MPSHFGTLHQPPPPWLANPATPPTEKNWCLSNRKDGKRRKSSCYKALAKTKTLIATCKQITFLTLHFCFLNNPMVLHIILLILQWPKVPPIIVIETVYQMRKSLQIVQIRMSSVKSIYTSQYATKLKWHFLKKLIKTSKS